MRQEKIAENFLAMIELAFIQPYLAWDFETQPGSGLNNAGMDIGCHAEHGEASLLIHATSGVRALQARFFASLRMTERRILYFRDCLQGELRPGGWQELMSRKGRQGAKTQKTGIEGASAVGCTTCMNS